MEIQNIIISNKLIAKFMQYNDVDCHNCKYSRDCNWIQCGLTEQEKDEQLLYHSSWDWLIPVVKKIKGLVCESEFTNRIGYNLHYEQDKYKLFISCIEFIKWYNKNK